MFNYVLLTRPVRDSPEFRRISTLPRRELTEPPLGWEDQWRGRLEGCGDPKCPYARGLKPIQRIALWEIATHRGLFGRIGAGGGKALISLLAPTVLGCTRPALVVPPRLVEQTHRVFEHLRHHWALVTPAVVSYSQLSNPRKVGVLEATGCDVLTMDEAHRAASATSATAKKIKLFLRSQPELPVVALSGTVLKRKVVDFAPLLLWTLKDRAPAPRDYPTRASWSLAMDDLSGMPNCPPGVLAQWMEVSDTSPREGYRRRIYQTPGCVGSSKLECDASLTLHEWAPKVPKNVTDALKALRRDWARPDGETFKEALDLFRHARSVAQGYFLRWTQEPPREWLDARRAWHAVVRRAVAPGHRGLESPSLYEKAIAEGRRPKPAELGEWERVSDTFTPVTETVWLSDYYLEAAVAWERKHGPALIWTDAPAVGERLAALSGIPYYGRGAAADKALADEAPGERSVILSSDVFGEGWNLQGWKRGLILAPPSSAKDWEQLLARQHRGDADEVDVWVGVPTDEMKEAVAGAKENARFIQELEGQPQRLLHAAWIELHAQ